MLDALTANRAEPTEAKRWWGESQTGILYLAKLPFRNERGIKTSQVNDAEEAPSLEQLPCKQCSSPLGGTEKGRWQKHKTT